MERKEMKLRLDWLKAVGWSLLVVIISMVYLGFLIHDDTGNNPKSTLYLFSVSFAFVIILTIACFAICKAYPKSVWFTPFLCNAQIVSSMLFEIPIWTESLVVWIILGIGIVLSIIGAIIGARKGQRRTMQEK
jgi:hypothetical protein